MLANRSMPASDVIPILQYENVELAVAWLCAAFGFTLRWRAGNHRDQLNVGNGCVVVTCGSPHVSGREVMVRVTNADAHHKLAVTHGVHIAAAPADHPYGERQYVARDLAGYTWTFSQSIADVDPATWGAEVGTLSA